MNIVLRGISRSKRSSSTLGQNQKSRKGKSMRPTYQLTFRQLLSLALLAAVCGAALFRLLPDRWMSAAAAAKSNAQTAQEKKKANNPVVHFEIGCRDLVKTKAFYGRLFEWDIAPTGVI